MMLDLAHVSAFYGKAQVLHDLSFTVGQGQVVALLGRNGAGKTTLLKTIMQMIAPRPGRVRFQGRDITGWPPHRVARAGLGYVPEERRIFTDLSVLENLEVGRQPKRAGTAQWSTERLFDLFPNLAERRRNRGRELSGGEQQMLAIARTLMGNPSCVLLDEPSEGIAPVIVEDMARAILELRAQGLTVLLSEQNLYFARAVASHALVLERGSLRFSGSLAELDARPELSTAWLAV